MPNACNAASTSSIIAPGPHTNASSIVSNRQQRVGEGLHLGGVQATVEEIHLLVLAAEQVVQREAREVAVLQVLQVLLEHHIGESPIAVEQGEAAARLARERRLDEREDRGDPAAGCEGDVVLGV